MVRFTHSTTMQRDAKTGDGVVVRLADGGDWVLPFRDPSRDEQEYDALLAAVFGAEDHAEAMRGELALMIFLLDRAYRLSVERFDTLLSFAPDDPALSAMQQTVHALAIESMRRSRAAQQANARPAGRGPATVHARPADPAVTI